MGQWIAEQVVLFSNCCANYLDSHRQRFQLDVYFEAIVCCEAYGYASTMEILRLVSAWLVSVRMTGFVIA